MSRIVDCEPWHLMRVALCMPRRDVEEAFALGFRSVQDVAVRRALEPGVKFAILDDEGTPQACFGIAELPIAGVGRMWLLRAEGAERFVKTGARAVKRIVAANEYRRIEAGARADCEPCRTFLKWLGFTYEGTRHAFYVDGGDLDEFAIISGSAA